MVVVGVKLKLKAIEAISQVRILPNHVSSIRYRYCLLGVNTPEMLVVGGDVKFDVAGSLRHNYSL
jgi:hypothetical protein